MLKSKSVHKLTLFFASLLLVIGILLSGIGMLMNDSSDYIKEDGEHRWYQIIYFDKNDNFHVGVNFNNGIQIISLF
ncbi:MAG: hypothetical protein RR630_04315 [Coprobacillus sp.]